MLIFLRQQNGALLVEILYFLAGPVMHHSGAVNNTFGASLSSRVVQSIGLTGNLSICSDISLGGPVSTKIHMIACSFDFFDRLYQAVFFHGSQWRVFFIFVPRTAYIKNHRVFQRGSTGIVSVTFSEGGAVRWCPCDDNCAPDFSAQI